MKDIRKDNLEEIRIGIFKFYTSNLIL